MLGFHGRFPLLSLEVGLLTHLGAGARASPRRAKACGSAARLGPMKNEEVNTRVKQEELAAESFDADEAELSGGTDVAALVGEAEAAEELAE